MEKFAKMGKSFSCVLEKHNLFNLNLVSKAQRYLEAALLRAVDTQGKPCRTIESIS